MKNLKLGILFIITLLIANTGAAQNLAAFEAIAKECGIGLYIPSTFVESTIVSNKNMEYEYAVKYPDKNFELRYAIRPIKFKTYPSDSIKKVMESDIALRNTSYEANLKSIIYSITGGYDYEFKPFSKAAVQEEFNADWGAITMVQLKSDFGKGWRFCMIVALHKDNVADAYYFYMTNAQETFPENMKPLFHSLRFDEDKPNQ